MVSNRITEKAFENRIKQYLKTKNAYFIKYWGGGQFTKAGVPDILCCLNGRFLGIEVKEKEMAKKTKKEPKDIVFLPPVGEKKEPVILSKELQEIKDYYHLGAETLLKLKQAIDSSKTSREAVRNFTSKVVMGEALATEIVDKLWKGDR